MALHVRLQLQFPQVKVLILGIFLALLGLASIVMGIVAFTKRVWGHYVATGLWGGTMIFATGTCAIIASQLRSPCSVKSYLVCSVFGIVTSFVMIVLSAGGLDYDSRFYNFAHYAHTKRHTATLLVHGTTLLLAFLSFIGNIISLIVCLKFIVYDRHQPVCETKVKRPSTGPLHRNAGRSNSESRVPLTGCHRSQRHNSRSKKNGSVRSRDLPRGDRRGSDGSRHSHRRRRKHEQSAPQRSSRRRDYQASRSTIEYENITNDNILQQRQQSGNRELCSEHYEVDLLPTAFDEEELPPYEPPSESHSHESADILPPNIPPDGLRHGQDEQTENLWSENIKPPVTPPSLDPEVRALFLANHELVDNLDRNSIQKRKPSTEKSNKIISNILVTQSNEAHLHCNSDVSNDVSNSGSHDNSLSRRQFASASCTSSVSHPLDTSLSNKTAQNYENMNTLSRDLVSAGSTDISTVGKHINMHNPAETNESRNFDSPAFHLRLEPEGRQDGEEKEDVTKPLSYVGGMPLDKLLESHSDDNNVDLDLTSPKNQVPKTSVDSFHSYSQSSSKDLNVQPLKPLKMGSSASAFHRYDGLTSIKSTENKTLNLSGLSDPFGGARPKETASTLPLNLDDNSPKSTCNIQRQSSWKDFLLPPLHNKDKPDQTQSSVKSDIFSNSSSTNYIKGKPYKFGEPPIKTVTHQGPTPPIFIPPVSLKSKKAALTIPLTSSGSTRPITSLHPRYHQPFPSNLSLHSQPHPPTSAVVSRTQPPLSSKDNDPRSPSVHSPELVNVSPSLRVELDSQVRVRPSLVGGEASVVQVEQQSSHQQQQQQGQRQPPQEGQRPPPQEGPRQPPLFSVLL